MTTLLLILLSLDYRDHPTVRRDETLTQRRYIALCAFDCLSGPGNVAKCRCRILDDMDGDCDVDLYDVADLYLMALPVTSVPDSPC